MRSTDRKSEPLLAGSAGYGWLTIGVGAVTQMEHGGGEPLLFFRGAFHALRSGGRSGA